MRVGRIAPVAAVAAAVLFTACKGDVKSVRVNANDAHIAARDTVRTLGPGDIRIASTDSAIELSLVGDSLMTGFGAKTRAKVAAATDTNKVKGTGFAADIEKMVKKTVAGALDHELHFPLSTISDVRYENGLLQFYGKDGKSMHMFERSKDSDGDRVEFSQKDADAFIAAFKAKKGARPPV
jgi:hypothetical protein